MKAIVILSLLFSVKTFAAITDVEVMSYNVENLFDANKDDGKDDWTFLPTKTKGKKEQCLKIRNDKYRRECLDTDWTAQKVQLKYKQIKKVVTRNGKSLPDILALQEVENENVVAGLAKELGFSRSITTNGPDERGVDVALLVTEKPGLKFVGSKEHLVTGETLKDKPTRPILEVELNLEGQPLFVFVNHWPSQSNPSESRLQAAKTVISRIQEIQSADSNAVILVMGDFNTLESDFPHPFKMGLLEGDKLVSINDLFMSDRSIDRKVKERMPMGTYFYYPKMQWNMLDYFFASKNLLDKSQWDIDPTSFMIYAAPFATEAKFYKNGYMKNSTVMGAPKGYHHNAKSADKAGFSDHFPVIVHLKKMN